MKKHEVEFRARVWLYPGPGGWHFLTLPASASRQVRSAFPPPARAWGSIPVSVSLGKLRWRTSVFPDRKSKSYLLPLRADIRKKAAIKAGQMIRVSIVVES